MAKEPGDAGPAEERAWQGLHDGSLKMQGLLCERARCFVPGGPAGHSWADGWRLRGDRVQSNRGICATGRAGGDRRLGSPQRVEGFPIIEST